MLLPLPRKKLRGVSFRNRSLQDIFRSSQEALRVLEVIPVPIGLHNTKIIVLLADGKHQRVHFYNRLLLKDVIPDTFVSSGNLTRDIDTLNSLHGCDFNEDDLELVGGTLKTKPNSLGYYEAEETGGEINYCAISLPVAHLSPSFFEHLDGGSETGKGFILKINGRSLDIKEAWEDRGIALHDLVWEETEGDIVVNTTGGLIIDQPQAPYLMGSGAPEEGTLTFENLSNKCYSIELIPVTGDTFPVVAETSGNVSYQQVDNSVIKFTLSPWKSLTCDMTHAKIIEFKPKDYSWVDKDRIALYARVYFGENLVKMHTNNIEFDVADLTRQSRYQVPNHGSLYVDSDLTWPTLEVFVKNIAQQFNQFSTDWRVPHVIQTSPVVQTAFLGVYKNAMTSIFQAPIPLTLRLVERDRATRDIVKNELIGSTSITASNSADLMVKARDFFTPLLEAKGFTVETYTISNGLSMTSSGFKLTKSSINEVTIKLTDGPWSPGWSDWNNTECHFKDVTVEGHMLTEEDFMHRVLARLMPYDGTAPDAVQGRTRIVFTTAKGAGLEEDQNTYDWIKEVNAGEEIIFESCAIRRPQIG